MRSQRSYRALFPLVLLLLALPPFAGAAMVRGRLMRGSSTAPGVAVTVSNPQMGRSIPSYSQGDGMHYLANVPPGVYVLEVWARPNSPPMTFQIQVTEPNTDIVPLNVP